MQLHIAELTLIGVLRPGAFTRAPSSELDPPRHIRVVSSHLPDATSRVPEQTNGSLDSAVPIGFS